MEQLGNGCIEPFTTVFTDIKQEPTDTAQSNDKGRDEDYRRERAPWMSDEDLDNRIKILSRKPGRMKTTLEKLELKRLRARKRGRRFRQKLSEEEIEKVKKRNREQRKAAYHN